MKHMLLVLILCMAAVTACDTKAHVAAGPVFNSKSTLLMTLPAGYEAGEVTFSEDGFHVAVVLKKDEKMCLSINSLVSPMYEFVRSPVFHAGSKQYAFIARKNGKECVVFHGKEGRFFDTVRTPFITAEGHVVYPAQRDGKWVIVVDNKDSKPFDSSDPSLAVSADGKRLAFVEQNSTTKKFHLTTCSIKLKEYAPGREYDEIPEVITSLSGTHLAYRVVKNAREALVLFDFRQPGCSEKESGWYEKVGNFVLANNGEHTAFFAQRLGKNYLVSDAHEWPCTDYQMLFDITVSDKGNALYTGAIEFSLILALDGKIITDRRESIDGLSFSSDAKQFLFVAGPCPLIPTEKPVEFAYLVIGDHESKKYDKIIGPRFSPDNTQVVFRARADGQRFLAVADATGKILREHSPYDEVWEYKFSPDGKSVGYGVRSGQELWWQVARLEQKNQ